MIKFLKNLEEITVHDPFSPLWFLSVIVVYSVIMGCIYGLSLVKG